MCLTPVHLRLCVQLEERQAAHKPSSGPFVAPPKKVLVPSRPALGRARAGLDNHPPEDTPPPPPPPPPLKLKLKLKLSTALRLTSGARDGPKLALAQQGITQLDAIPPQRAAAVRASRRRALPVEHSPRRASTGSRTQLTPR